jgi:uncharacterized DUF497 family protein
LRQVAAVGRGFGLSGKAWFPDRGSGMRDASVVFEFDPDKSAANFAKHGIDFEAAQALWLDERRITLPSDHTGEERQLEVGRIGGRLWTVAVTLRGKAVRVISARRARRREEAMYESQDD